PVGRGMAEQPTNASPAARILRIGTLIRGEPNVRMSRRPRLRARGKTSGSVSHRLNVLRVDEPEHHPGRSSTREARRNVNPEVGETDDLHHPGADGDGGIERAAGYAADGKGAGHARHANCKAVKRTA